MDLRNCDGILINTFDALEPIALTAISNGECVTDGPCPPVHTVGPLIAEADKDDDDKGNPNQKNDCLPWLDQQPSRSVVFLCFGSRGSFCTDQLKEIGNGLERSGVVGTSPKWAHKHLLPMGCHLSCNGPPTRIP